MLPSCQLGTIDETVTHGKYYSTECDGNYAEQQRRGETVKEIEIDLNVCTKSSGSG